MGSTSVLDPLLFKTQVRKSHMKVILKFADGAAMVAEVLYNLTPRHPPSQVVDNLPRYAG